MSIPFDQDSNIQSQPLLHLNQCTASISFLTSVSPPLGSGETSGGIAASSASFASRSPHLPSSPLFPAASSLRRQAAAGLLLLLSLSSLLLSFAPTGGDNNTAGSSTRASSLQSAPTPVRTAGEGEITGRSPSLLFSGEDSTSHRQKRLFLKRC
ncbi:hypothetical protein KY284_035748 [Solanum tuberosum]|nr:hypothetical protein KY284_035748 [Solanum tuberosum]